MKEAAFLLLIATLTGCTKLDIESGTPKCIVKEIKRFNKKSACEHANVKEYSFQGKTVYLFEPGACGADLTSDVFRSDCQKIGYIGGLAGNGQVNGGDFYTATFLRTVWEK